MRRRQQGLAAVEFALVGVLAMVVLIGVIEVARYFFVWNAVVEATRRGARVAAVTSGSDEAKTAVTAVSTYLHGLSNANVTVSYYDETGAVTAVAADMRFVTVSITGYTHSVLIPGAGLTVTVPAFTTTLPVESLGFVPTS